MSQIRIVRDDSGKEVAMFTTPSGVRAVVDTSIPEKALREFAAKLKRKMRRRELAHARKALAGIDR